jgi:regulator of protease activity HflC (stomatin/prohibitin superfamily)
LGTGADEGTLMALWVVIITVVALIVYIAWRSVSVIGPHEQGLKIVMGRYVGRLGPGLNLVPPLVTKVTRVDLRTQHVDVPSQSFLTKDRVPVRVDVTMALRVVDPEKAAFQVADYRNASVDAALSLLGAAVSDLTLEEALDMRRRLLGLFQAALDEATDPWGVKVEKLDVRRIDPGEAVLASMRAEAAAAKELGAAVKRADAHMARVMSEDPGAADEREVAIQRMREALDCLPEGLPESLWGWQADELAQALVDGERASTPQGTPLVRVDGRWYVADPRDMATFLKEWKGDPFRPLEGDHQGLWRAP